MLSLEEIYHDTFENELEALKRIRYTDTDEIQSKSDKGMLWYYNLKFALGAFFLEKDIGKAKEYFHRCGRIDEYLIKKYDSRLLDSGMANISYALLSDNLGLIKRYADLKHSKFDWMVKHGHSTLMFAVQQVIKEEWDKVQYCLDIMSIKNQTLNKVLLPDRKFLEGFLSKDKQKMEAALYLLLKDHKKRNKHMGIAQDYISIPALGYAKLAWLKGIEVDIDHPLVPKELLPYQPLEKYEDKYDFLKEV